MSARQGRLDASYFSGSQQSPPTKKGSTATRGPQSRNQTQSQSQSQSQSQRRSQKQSQIDDGADSDGSEGMNNIRMSQSPVKLRNKGEASEVVDLISDLEEEEEDGNQDTEPVPAIPEASSSRTRNEAEVVVIDDESQDGITTNSAPPIAKKVIPLSSTKPPSTIPKKRVDLASSPSRAHPPIPIPAKFTRLKAISEDSPVQAGRRLVPFVELEKWSEERKAKYTLFSEPSNRAESSGHDNLTAFLGPDMIQDPTIPMPTVHEVLDSSDEEIVKPPPKRHARLAVEIPTRKPKSLSNTTKRIAEVRQSPRLDEDNENGRPMEKSKGKGKGKQVPDFEVDSEAEHPRHIKSLTKGKGKERARILDSDSDEPRRSSKKDKGKGRARAYDEESVSEESDRPKSRKDKSTSNGKKRSHHTSDSKREKKQRRKEREPSLTQGEYLDELALDESFRFKTRTRLREKKETPAQRILRKLQDKRRGIVRADTISDDSEPEDESDNTSDSARDSRDGRRRSSSFIEDDGGVVDTVMLPHEFSLDSAQTPEYKFKVVFQYFVFLTVHGSDILPLKGERKEYFLPQLHDLRRKVEGHRDGRVRSQIWPPNYVMALKTYPQAIAYYMSSPEEHCIACNRMNYKSHFRLEFRGRPYDPNTYEPLPTVKQKRRARAEKRKAAKAKAKKRARQNQSQTPSSQGSDSSDEGTTSEEEDKIRAKDDIFLGPHCKKRSILYHSMAHWEWILWNRIQNYYHDLLRAKSVEFSDDSDASPSESDSDISEDESNLRRDKRNIRREQTRLRVKRLNGKELPKQIRDADVIQEWMDKQQYVLTEFKWMEDLEDQSKRLEFDRNKDE